MLLFLIGCAIGANISLLLYACILSGKQADEHINNEGGQDE